MAILLTKCLATNVLGGVGTFFVCWMQNVFTKSVLLPIGENLEDFPVFLDIFDYFYIE